MCHDFLLFKTKNIVRFTNLNNDGIGSLREVLSTIEDDTTVMPSSNLEGIIYITERIKVKGIKRLILDMNSSIDIRGWELQIVDCDELIVKNTIVRTTDIEVRKHGKPQNSKGLDSINLLNCSRVLVVGCSLWSSCDEITSVVKCNEVHFDRCLIILPLGDPDIHPYGKQHAECSNNSATDKLCYYRCVFAFSRLRAPLLETSDVTNELLIRCQVMNCVIYGFTQSGSRYHSGVLDHLNDTTYYFQFINNLYLNDKERGDAIVADVDYGISSQVKICIKDCYYKIINSDDKMSKVRVNANNIEYEKQAREQVRSKMLFKLECNSYYSQIKDPYKFAKDIINNAGVGDTLDIKAREAILSGKKWNTLFKTWNEVLEFLDR